MSKKAGVKPLLGIVTSDAITAPRRMKLIAIFAASVVLVAVVIGLGVFGYHHLPIAIHKPKVVVTPQMQAISAAQATLNKATTPAEKSVAYEQLGTAYQNNGQLDQAVEAYNNAIQTNPSTDNSRKILPELIGTYLTNGQTSQAISAIQQLIPILQKSTTPNDQHDLVRYQSLLIDLEAPSS